MDWLVIMNEAGGYAYMISAGEWEDNIHETVWGRYPTEELAKERLADAEAFASVLFG
jgi:PHD/YefM family antitoxin component YafN of YafNO toxin-antitoxin module